MLVALRGGHLPNRRGVSSESTALIRRQPLTVTSFRLLPGGKNPYPFERQHPNCPHPAGAETIWGEWIAASGDAAVARAADHHPQDDRLGDTKDVSPIPRSRAKSKREHRKRVQVFRMSRMAVSNERSLNSAPDSGTRGPAPKAPASRSPAPVARQRGCDVGRCPP